MHAYPENHTVWDKLVFPADQTLLQFMTWLEASHGLKLDKWNFILGITSPYHLLVVQTHMFHVFRACLFSPKFFSAHGLVPPSPFFYFSDPKRQEEASRWHAAAHVT